MKLLAPASWRGAGVQACCLSGGECLSGVWGFLKDFAAPPLESQVSGPGFEKEISGGKETGEALPQEI